MYPQTMCWNDSISKSKSLVNLKTSSRNILIFRILLMVSGTRLLIEEFHLFTSSSAISITSQLCATSTSWSIKLDKTLKSSRLRLLRFFKMFLSFAISEKFAISLSNAMMMSASLLSLFFIEQQMDLYRWNWKQTCDLRMGKFARLFGRRLFFINPIDSYRVDVIWSDAAKQLLESKLVMRSKSLMTNTGWKKREVPNILKN